MSKEGEYLIIEAKSHESKDAYNTLHKIYGQLLKEHGKDNDDRKRNFEKIALGILIPKDKPTSDKSNTKKTGYEFYRKGCLGIPEFMFSKFGDLVKAKYVFVCSIHHKAIDIYTWSGFRNGEEPIHQVPSPT